MIVSKGNLLTVGITTKDKQIPELDTVHIMKTGATVSMSRNVVVVVQPVNIELRKSLPIKNDGEQDVTLYSESVKDALKNIPNDSQFGGLLEHCNIDGNGKILIHDGKREKIIRGKKCERPFLPWKQVLRKTIGERKGKRIVVNLCRLKLLIETLNKICPDSAGESPVYVEFGNKGELILRMVNRKTGQRVLAVMLAYIGTEGKWLEEDEWEKGLLSIKKLKLKPRKKK